MSGSYRAVNTLILVYKNRSFNFFFTFMEFITLCHRSNCKTSTDQSTRLYCIGNTQVSDRSIYHQVYTELQFIGKCNSYRLILCRETIRVCSEINKQNVNVLCEQNVKFLMLKLVVHKVTVRV